MKILQTLFIMAFTHEILDNHALPGAARMAADLLARKDNAFARKMCMLGEGTVITFSNQQYVSIIHSPQVMQNSMGGWLKNQRTPFEPDNLFYGGLKDPKNRENYFLFYFHFR